MKRIVCILLVFALSLSVAGCDKSQTEGNLTDDRGKAITVTEKDRVAALHASFADCYLLSGGTLCALTEDAVNEHGIEKGEAVIVGTAKTVDVEALASSGATVALLSLDLVAHLELLPILTDLGIKCAYFRVDTFSDYSSVMARFCAITGRADLYEKNVTEVKERIQFIKDTAGCDSDKSFMLLRAYSQGVKAKGEDNLAGIILKEFGLENLKDSYPSPLEDVSLEHIIECDPDYIFLLTMGSEEAALAYLNMNFESNPAFSDLKAVKNGGYYLLPKELFHYKPNERWDESYEFLSKLLYPERFD